MTEIQPLTMELTIGHTDKRGTTHTRVTFGKRLSGRELFAIDADPQSEIATQYEALLHRAAITEFGSMRMPVSLAILLELDSIDRDDLSAAFNQFTLDLLGDRKAEPIADNKVKLALGYERNGLVYDLVEFGRRLTGMDEVEADKLRLTGIRRVCFLIGKQVTRLAQSEGASELSGPMGLEIFENLVTVDIHTLRLASEVWRQSFRRAGAAISGHGSINGAGARPENGLERSGDSGAAD